MRLKMYKLAKDKNDYITATKRKYFKYALNYVLNRYETAKDGSLKDEILNACTVNKISFIFDFENMNVAIKSNQDDRFYKHKLIEV